MYGILGEEDDDAETIAVLIKRLTNQPNAHCFKRGYNGFGDLLKKGAAQLRSFQQSKCKQFIVCIDADGPDPLPRREEVMKRVIRPSGIETGSCAVVPVHTIEAWILADIAAIINVLPSWTGPLQFRQNPEGVSDPKERIKVWSQKCNKKPNFSPSTHNPLIAKHLQLATLRKRCPSFEHLAFFITGARMTAGQN
jgi:hypothetical protein